MRIAILSCANLARAQYIYKYLFLLDKYECTYDVIFWNRTLENVDIPCNARFIGYDKYIDSYKPFYAKIIDYIRFSKFVNKTIKNNKYDKLIVLTTPMAISILPLCLRKYYKKYIFDFRDLTKEYIFPYKKIVQIIARKSKLFIISSPGYLKYFTKKNLDNYVLCHNTLEDIVFKRELEISQNDPIRVSYWGAIRQISYCKKICDLFGNDDRFIFFYHGDGAYVELKRYCEKRSYKNIFFTGKYSLNELSDFANKTDILFCAYETDFVTTPSLAVKVYDSVEYKLPLIVSEGSFMKEYLGDYSYVFNFELTSQKLDELYSWYKKLNYRLINLDFEKFLNKIKHEEKYFQNELKRFVVSDED